VQVVLGEQKNPGHSVLVGLCVGLVQTTAFCHKKQLQQS